MSVWAIVNNGAQHVKVTEPSAVREWKAGREDALFALSMRGTYYGKHVPAHTMIRGNLVSMFYELPDDIEPES